MSLMIDGLRWHGGKVTSATADRERATAKYKAWSQYRQRLPQTCPCDVVDNAYFDFQLDADCSVICDSKDGKDVEAPGPVSQRA